MGALAELHGSLLILSNLKSIETSEDNVYQIRLKSCHCDRSRSDLQKPAPYNVCSLFTYYLARSAKRYILSEGSFSLEIILNLLAMIVGKLTLG